jgi:hypothetical protein
VQDKQFEIALDITKQLLTLATAVIAVTVSFWKDVINLAEADTTARFLIGTAWLLSLFRSFAVSGACTQLTVQSPNQ